MCNYVFSNHQISLKLQMVQDPTQFDVLVMPNLYGDILRFVFYVVIQMTQY